VVLGYHIPFDPHLLGVSPAGGFALARGVYRWTRERRGMLATNFAELTGFMRLAPDSPKPEIQYEFVIALAMDHGREVYWRHGMSCHVMILHPKSRGTLRIASRDHRDDPLIDFRYFSHADDLATLAEGAQRVARIFETPTFRRRIRRDLVTAHCQTDEDWREFCRNGGGTNYHPVGSCRMGPDPATSVVDARLRVHGLRGLRIIDSSIMPKIPGGNTTAPTVMIGEKGADLIKADWGGVG
jgi:choline dehydrogenase-like flavoprotein